MDDINMFIYFAITNVAIYQRDEAESGGMAEMNVEERNMPSQTDRHANMEAETSAVFLMLMLLSREKKCK